MYYGSVGRGCNLILNGNIDRDGLVPEADMKRLKEFGDEIRRRFGKSVAETSGRGNVGGTGTSQADRHRPRRSSWSRSPKANGSAST